MNIALFSDSYLPTKSGVVTVVIQLRKILEEMGHHVVIVTVSSNDKDYEEEPDPNIMRVMSILSPLGEGQYIGFPHRKAVAKFLQKNNIQIIHSHTEFFLGQMAVIVGKMLDIPVVATTHTMWEDYYRYYLFMGELIPRRLVRKIVKTMYKKFYALINVSKKAHDYFTSPFCLPKTPSAIIPNAIDTQKFIGSHVTEEDKAALRKSLGIAETDRVIICVGRVVEEKRVIELADVLIRVVRGRDNAKALFVGSGGALEILKEKVSEAGVADKILFTGFIDWRKVYAYYAISNIYVTASLSEMHSMTVLEALSLGLPAVCRRDTSFSDTIFHGVNGYFADSDNAMDSYLYALIDNPEMCSQMGEKGREISKRFTLEKHGKRTVAFYNAVLSAWPQKIQSKTLEGAVKSADQN